MRNKTDPDRTRRSLLKAAAIIAGAVAAYGPSARAQEGYYIGDGSGANPTDKPPWAGGPGCNPNGNCPGNRPCFVRGTRILTDDGRVFLDLQSTSAYQGSWYVKQDIPHGSIRDDIVSAFQQCIVTVEFSSVTAAGKVTPRAA